MTTSSLWILNIFSFIAWTLFLIWSCFSFPIVPCFHYHYEHLFTPPYPILVILFSISIASSPSTPLTDGLPSFSHLPWTCFLDRYRPTGTPSPCSRSTVFWALRSLLPTRGHFSVLNMIGRALVDCLNDSLTGLFSYLFCVLSFIPLWFSVSLDYWLAWLVRLHLHPYPYIPPTGLAHSLTISQTHAYTGTFSWCSSFSTTKIFLYLYLSGFLILFLLLHLVDNFGSIK